MNRPFGLAVLAVALLVVTQGSQAATIVYTANLNGLSESPPNASPGTGFAMVILDNVAQTLEVKVNFSGLLGTTTASHIHSATAIPGVGTAGVATTTPTFTGFPLGVTSGSYDSALDLTQSISYNPAFVTATGGTIAGAEAALLAGMAAGDNYLNIHTSVVPGGEIRGFLALSQSIPEPASIVMLGNGILGVIACGLRRAARTRA